MAQSGVSFTTDLSSVGTNRSGSRLFGGASHAANILEEERRLIDKVFSIVDRDNSGSIGIDELKDMFKHFGVEDSPYLTNAIKRIMTNVDKDFDGMISPQEFYKLLSQKFEKDDDVAEIQAVFNRMDKNKDKQLDVEELYDVAQQLGETITKAEIKDMIESFSTQYQQKLKAFTVELKKDPKKAPPEKPRSLDFDDFLKVMHEDL